MIKEKTLSIIKPDAVAKNQAEEILKRLSNSNLSVIAIKKNYQLTREKAEQFYQEHHGKPFFEGLVQSMISGPVFIQILEGENAISRYRELMGPTDPTKAHPGTLRADFGGGKMPMNAVHGSDSLESAEREISFFFEK
jgi:nucleoside-diphosphate kinase